MMGLIAVPLAAQPEYAQLLSEMLPSVIHSEQQNELYLHQVEELLQQDGSLTSAQGELLELLTVLIEDFEEKNYSLPKASPLAMITFLMDQHGLKQIDLSDVFGTRSITSEVLSGKRELNKEHIRRLSERFHVSPELFF